MAKKRRSPHLKQIVDLAADAFVEAALTSFSYGIEVRAQIYEDLEELTGFRLRDDDEAA
jgi:NADH:ubiquinone oxidoreductase subunit D